MFPAFPQTNHADVYLADSVLLGYNPLENARRMFSSNFFNGSLGKLSGVMRFALDISSFAAAFFGRVSHVFKLRANPKMGRIATWPIVAGMAHKKTIWDWAVGQFKRHAVSRPLSTEWPHIVTRSVTVPNKWTLPVPAFALGCDFNIAPKLVWVSFVQRHSSPGPIFQLRLCRFLHVLKYKEDGCSGQSKYGGVNAEA